MTNPTDPKDQAPPPISAFWCAIAQKFDAEYVRLPEVEFPPRPSKQFAEQTLEARLLAAEEEWNGATVVAALEFVTCGACLVHPVEEVRYFIRARLQQACMLAFSLSAPWVDDSPVRLQGLKEGELIEWFLVDAWENYGRKLWARSISERIAYGDVREAAGVEQALRLVAPQPPPERPEKVLARVVIPDIYLEDASLEQVLASVYDLACAVDSSAAVVHPIARPDALAAREGWVADVDLHEIPYGVALDQVAEYFSLRVLVGSTTYLIPREADAQELITREYGGVPIAFFEGEVISSQARRWFERQGITFENGADLTYCPKSQRLWICNVWPELDRCEELLLAAGVDIDPLASLGEV